MTRDLKLDTDIALLILAAGSSSRMGQPKQLLKYQGETLLRRTIEAALKTGFPVYVIVGSNKENHKRELANLNIHIIENPTWEKGMGNSLKTGVEYIIDHNPDLEALIIMVCDQPKLTPKVLIQLAGKYSHGSQLVASQYGNTFGVPALFGKPYFKELLAIEDKQGAKALISKHLNESVIFEEGIIDIDTPEDYQKLTGTSI